MSLSGLRQRPSRTRYLLTRLCLAAAVPLASRAGAESQGSSAARLHVSLEGGGGGQLVIEGLEVGKLPWTGSVEAGEYEMWAVADGRAVSTARRVKVADGEAREVELALRASNDAGERSSCRADEDCPVRQWCSSGECRLRPESQDEEDEDYGAQLGQACGVRECNDGLLCVRGRCMATKEAPYAYRHAVGVGWTGAIGVGGVAAYPAPAHFILPQADVALGPSVRYNPTIGYVNLNARGGLRFSLLGFGFPLQSVWASGQQEVVIEPGLDALVMSETALFDDIDVYASTQIWGRVVYRRGDLLLTATPVSLELVWLRMVGDWNATELFSESGVNYGFGLGVGVLL